MSAVIEDGHSGAMFRLVSRVRRSDVSTPTEIDWHVDGDCRWADPDLFYPEKGQNHYITAAKAICSKCPVQEKCFKAALARPFIEDYGVWGGTTRDERQEMRKRRR